MTASPRKRRKRTPLPSKKVHCPPKGCEHGPARLSIKSVEVFANGGEAEPIARGTPVDPDDIAAMAHFEAEDGTPVIGLFTSEWVDPLLERAKAGASIELTLIPSISPEMPMTFPVGPDMVRRVREHGRGAGAV